ncbi:tape measure protein [Arthrobacter phage Isolde]|uniref:Tape measure protein n=1 Tax=Arthrobacter phage Isolde TaxID=2419610 RepID=A0A3G3M4R0_9CAUD|nr:tail length tape measure protein [Arthrobacter phage Isolde]AYR00988.1 tape measure protein [Arthrobacter phage Isolde]
MATRSISIALEAKVQGFVSGLKTAQHAANDFARRSAEFAKNHEQSMDRIGRSSMLMGTGILAGVGVAVKSYMDFDKAMSDVNASTHETAANMDLLREAAIGAGADTAFSASEAARGIDELAKAGVSTKDILAGGLKGSLDLAAAGGQSVAESAEIAASALTQFQLSGDKVPHVADLLAAAAGKAQGSVSDMGMALNQAGLVANMTGLSIEETTGGLAAFASAGLTGSDAGTSFKSMLQRLTPQSKEAAEKMAELGISAYNAQGEFVGLDAFSKNLNDSMKDLDSESRAAAMGVIFGSDAVRAANVLYEQGAKGGIKNWIDAVNDTGYAAETAALKQDNLAGDFEKLTGSLDSVFLQSASGANDVLRQLVQGAEDFVDSIGDIPGPVLQAGVGIAGVAGGMALLGGAVLTALPKLQDGVAAFRELEKAAPRAAGALKGAAIAGTIISIGVALGKIAEAKAGDQIERSVAKTTRSLIDMSNQRGNILEITSALDHLFKTKDGSQLVDGVDNLDSALTRMFKKDFFQSANDWGNEMAKALSLGTIDFGTMKTLEDSFKTIDDQLASFVSSGNADVAADSFSKIEEAARNQGIGIEQLKTAFPGYFEALQQADADAQVAAGAMDKITTSGGQVIPVTEDVAKALEDIGLSAEGAVTALDKYAAALVRAGLSNLSVSDAARNSQAAIDAVTDSIAKNGTTLNTDTEAGRANQAAFEGVASARLSEVEAMARATDAYGNHIYSQDQLHGKMTTAYSDLVAAAGQFGITGEAADTLARKALGIPPGVNIEAYLKDFASAQLDNVGIKVANLDGKTANVYVNTHETTFINTVRSDSVQNSTGGRQGTKPTGFAVGGAITGPGTGTSDDILALLSNGEHVLTADEVRKMGGQAEVYRFRRLLDSGMLPKFATGGAAARRETWIDYQRDSRRGNGYRSVAGSLSNAYSFADRLTSLADSGNVGAASIRNLYTAAGRGEAGLRTLHARADRLSASLEKARGRVTDLSQARDSIRGALSGEFSISDAMKNTNPFRAVTLQGIQGAANAVLARIRTFAGKLNKLRAMGYSGAVLEEIAGLGSVEGMVAADALLKGSKADVKNLNGVYTAIDSASKAAGTYVTDAMYKGGINAANGLVKGLQSQEKAIEQQMLKIGLGMEGALKKALGIRSPSRKAAAIGDNFAGTLADRLQAGASPVAKQAKALGDAMSVVPKSYTPATTYRALPSQAQTATAPPVYVQNPFTGEYLLARTATVAEGVVAKADGQSQYTRTGAR